MEDLEVLIEDLVKKLKRRDRIAAVLVSTAFALFALLMLVILDVIVLGWMKIFATLVILAATWLSMAAGIYILTSTPTIKIPTRFVADSEGVQAISRIGYKGRVFVTPETMRKIPPAVGLRLNLSVHEVTKAEMEKYKRYGDEMAAAIVAAKNLKAKILSSKKGRVEGVEVITVEDLT